VRTIEVAADKQAEQRDSIKSDRKDDAQGGMRFFIPAFAHDDAHALLVKLRLPREPGAARSRPSS
jgi:Ca-activated chloride channel family protein